MPAKKVFQDIVSVFWNYSGVSFLSATIIWFGIWLLYKKQNIWTLVLLTYVFIVLNITLLDRGYTAEPFKNILVGLSFRNEYGKINYGAVENCVMLMPLIPLVGLSSCSLKAWQSFLLCFGFSSFIEIMQGIFHLGATQLSDIVFNTLGGMVGWLVYRAVLAVISRLSD